MWLTAVLAGYLIGSIPFGLLIAKIWNIDIRRYGSGNIGATNVFRVLGPGPGAVAFTLDLLKGTLAVYLGYWLGGDPQLVLLTGFSAVVGHMYPVFLGFKGGKGAATGLGVLLGIAPEVFAASAVFTLLIILATRYVSVASLATSALVVILFTLLKKPLPYQIAAIAVTVLIVVRHIPNIQRLIAGTENKI